jgi:hypothetical protein
MDTEDFDEDLTGDLNLRTVHDDDIENALNLESTEEYAALLSAIDAAVMEDFEEDGSDDDKMVQIGAADSEVMNGEAYRLHAIFSHTQRYRAGSTKPIVPNNLPYANIFLHATVEGLSAANQASLLLPFFAIMHPIDRFPLHWLPQAGTQTCCFCGKDHADEGWRRVWQCAKEAAEAEAQRIWMEKFSRLAESPCAYRQPRSGKICNFKTDKAQSMADHMYLHGLTMKKSLACTLGGGGHDESIRFDAVDSLVSHWISNHGYFPFKEPT